MRVFPIAAAFALVSPALAGNWSEGVNGDISSNRLAPSLLTLSLGGNAVTGSFGSGDLDYLRIDVPVGLQLSAINVTSYSGGSVSFLGMQSGATFTVTPASAQPGDMLGYGHFGAGDIGADILPAVATGGGSIGFSTPLASGSYTLWLQEIAGTTSYGLNFTTVPAPAAGLPLMLGALAFRRRRAGV